MRVSFFGGEPVLAWGLVKWGVERASAVARAAGLREPPHFHLTTNGTLLTDERLDFMADRGFSMIVSIDGPEVYALFCGDLSFRWERHLAQRAANPGVEPDRNA